MIEEINLKQKKVQQTIWSNNFWILKGFSNTVAATRRVIFKISTG